MYQNPCHMGSRRRRWSRLAGGITPYQAHGRHIPIAYDPAHPYRSRHPGLGDLFNDVMSGIVPGWESRPQWMKDIKVKVTEEDVIKSLRQFAPETAAQAENILIEKGEAAARDYLSTQAKGAVRNPLVWVGGGVLFLIIVGQMLPKGRKS